MNEEEKLYAPLPNGLSVEVEQLPVNVSKKTLGISTNRAGECDKQLEVIETTIETWTNRLETGHLPAKWAWVSYFHQLWSNSDMASESMHHPWRTCLVRKKKGSASANSTEEYLPAWVSTKLSNQVDDTCTQLSVGLFSESSSLK